MANEVLQTIYDLWVNSEDYRSRSALENNTRKDCGKKISEIIGEGEYDKISDEVLGLACDAEIAGFDNGFRYGIMFMNGMLKGGALA